MSSVLDHLRRRALGLASRGRETDAMAGGSDLRVDFADPTIATREDVARAWEDTHLYDRWRRRIKVGDANDFVVAVSASSSTGVSGSGKTTLGTNLAKRMDDSESGFNAAEQATLDAGALAYDVLPDVEKGSALIYDEAQGAPGTDSVNKRRGMTSEAIDAINAILANRDMRVTLVVIIQQLSMLDKSLLPLIDAWLLIRKEPSDPDGPIATHHKLVTDDYDLRNPSIKTPALEDLSWDRIPHDDPDYQEMEQLKQEAKRKQSTGEDDNREWDKEHQIEIAQELRSDGETLESIAERSFITYSREWVRQHTDAPEEVASDDD